MAPLSPAENEIAAPHHGAPGARLHLWSGSSAAPDDDPAEARGAQCHDDAQEAHGVSYRASEGGKKCFLADLRVAEACYPGRAVISTGNMRKRPTGHVLSFGLPPSLAQ